MRLVFTKGAGKSDTMTVVRPGRLDEVIDCPKQRIIPHDMVHYAVESVLDTRGFLGRVAAGEDADFRMQAEAVSDGSSGWSRCFKATAGRTARRRRSRSSTCTA